MFISSILLFMILLSYLLWEGMKMKMWYQKEEIRGTQVNMEVGEKGNKRLRKNKKEKTFDTKE